MSRIEIVEVGPRDGLQNEKVQFSTENKVALIERLIAAGARRIEAVSFVNPKRVPQMADAEAVMAAVPRRADVKYIGLVMNARGFERALACARRRGELCRRCVGHLQSAQSGRRHRRLDQDAR